MKNTNKIVETFEHPLLTVDMVIFSIINDKLQTLLIQRKDEPFKDCWAIPGGFVRKGESLEEASMRELVEETSVRDVYLEQLYTFGTPGRDPRGRVITVAYFALVSGEGLKIKADSDAKDVRWFPVNKLPVLAFDHRQILQTGIERLRNKISYSSVVFGLLPAKFRLSELQKVYEVILGRKQDKRNFRKKMLSLGLLEKTGQREIGPHRPAMLYQFKMREVVVFD